METKDQEDVEKAVPSGSSHQGTSDDADTTEMNSSNTEREARPSAERMPIMKDIVSRRRETEQTFGTFSFSRKKNISPLVGDASEAPKPPVGSRRGSPAGSPRGEPGTLAPLQHTPDAIRATSTLTN